MDSAGHAANVDAESVAAGSEAPTEETETDQRHFDRHVAYFLAMTCSPYSIIENDGFTKLLKFLSPDYHLPDRTAFSLLHIPALYVRTKQSIRKRLRDAEFVALTIDRWTSHNDSQFICVSASFVDIHWNLQTVTLACRELHAYHKAQNVADILKSIMAEFDIQPSQISAVTTDAAANLIAGVGKLDLNHVACFAQAINAIVHKMLDNHFIKTVLMQTQSIYNLIAYNSDAQDELKMCQIKLKLPLTRMPSSCKSRWWSEMAHIKFVIDNETALGEFLTSFADGTHARSRLDTINISRLKMVYALLEQFEVVAKALDTEQDITCSLIEPMLETVRSILTERVKTEPDELAEDNAARRVFGKRLLELAKELDNMYKSATAHHEMCTYIDPRVGSSNIDLAQATITFEVTEYNKTKTPADPPRQVSRAPDGSPLAKLQKMFNKTHAVNISCDAEGLDAEMTRFRSQPALGLAADPFQWWSCHHNLYPQLAFVARKYLSIAATSVASERVFSERSADVATLRASLTDEHVDEFLFLMHNKKYVNV